ncbi:glycosyltransferase family protein 47 [Striga asiatica]|uniref:Glycosyltransferase family protein 47 n=1 Tax=Striga asiatica TaxID=4170 RepID=A0A5A7P8P3_STRAF|nr:glycosyltransferase family protein 47 [Striga asiatica]
MGSSPTAAGWRCKGGGRSNRRAGNAEARGAWCYLGLCLVVLGAIGGLYGRYVLPPNVRRGSGCREDDEGSWAVGVYYGESPFSLKPIEAMNIWKDSNAAWPVANPVITCASISDAGFPTNFVADPFLYVQGDILYMFYEAKNSITEQGDIGVSQSIDNGATWKQLGIALDEDWHLSYPYVFDYNGNIYMMPEGSEKGDLRLYRAVDFPLKWTLDRIILQKPLIDSVIFPHEGRFYLFGWHHKGIVSTKNGHLEIWHSTTPLGPWKPHAQNPIHNTDKSMGTRNGGRPFVYNGNIYRVGQDRGNTYGERTRVFKVEILTPNDYKEVEVELLLEKSSKGINAWDGARRHHMDVQKLSSGQWIAVVDGDRVRSGDSSRRFVLGCVSVIFVATLLTLGGILVGVVKCAIPLSHNNVDKRKRPNCSSRSRLGFTRLNRASAFMYARIRVGTCVGATVVCIIVVIIVIVTCFGVEYLYGGSGAHEPYPINGHYSQFTLLTMTYDARLWNLKMYVKHYSRCSSVREIVVVWNRGSPPNATDFDSAVPVRVRVEDRNSLNNRFKPDPLIKTRAVLELDDDIMMTCNDVERGFRVWRENPERIVGFYPRLTAGMEYRGEKYARERGGYDVVLTGAAFVDHRAAFARYWGEKAGSGRAVVDGYLNCEDLLMNYLWGGGVEYVGPTWVVDMSKFSGVAISRNTKAHYGVRSRCLREFADMYGSLNRTRMEFGRRKDGWDV